MAKKRNGNKSTDLSTAEVGELVEQPHGGALRNGGTNSGGPGRPPSAIREHCRGSFAERVPILEDIADGKTLKQTVHHKGETLEVDISASVKERVQAIDVLAKYGGVDKLALTVDEQPEREWTPERLAEAWEHIQAVRSIKQLERLLVGKAESDG